MQHFLIANLQYSTCHLFFPGINDCLRAFVYFNKMKLKRKFVQKYNVQELCLGLCRSSE